MSRSQTRVNVLAKETDRCPGYSDKGYQTFTWDMLPFDVSGSYQTGFCTSRLNGDALVISLCAVGRIIKKYSSDSLMEVMCFKVWATQKK